MLFRAEAVVGPILPMVMWFNFRKRFIFGFLSFAEDVESPVGLKQKSTFFADDEGLVCSGFDGGQPEGRERGEKGVVVVVQDELFSSESAAAWVRDRADVVG